MTLRQLTRVTGYPFYGAGGHQSIGRLPLSISGEDLINADGKWVSTIRAVPFGMRLFVDSWSIVPETTSNNQSFTIKLNPTEQNFYDEDFLKLLHANNRRVIFCPSGLFDWLVVPGYSQRKSACYDHSLSPLDPLAWADFAHLFKLLAEYFKGKEYKVTLQFGNELDFRWNVVKELTPEEIAVGQWECVKAVQAVNPDQEIMLGCTLNPKIDTHRRIKNKMKELAAAEGKTLPKRIIISDNHYIRDSGGNQGGGLADTPESQWEQTFVYRTELNSWLKEDDLEWKFEITEHGYSNSPSTSFAALKQRCPALEGVSHDEAPGVLWFRSMLMYGSFSECVGVSWYHCKDGYEAEPFTYIGINWDKDFGGHEDWSSKPVQDYMVEQMNLYGDIDGLVKYQRINNIYYATLPNGKTLHWSDKVNVGTVTPKPTETTIIPPTNNYMELKVVNKKLQWVDGVPCILKHADSPESRLRDSYRTAFRTESENLAFFGMNAITCTMRGDDITDITPWSANNPSNGADVTKLHRWHDDLKYFIDQCASNGERGVVILYLGERTNFQSISLDKYKEWIDVMSPIFEDISGHLIFGWEEIGQNMTPQQMADWSNPILSYLKTKLPKCLTMLHNNPGQKPWNANSIADIMCIQETSMNAMGTSGTDAFNKGYAVHLHEPYNGFRTSNSEATNLSSLTELLNQAKGITSGYGIFAADYDTQSPDASKLDYLYTELADRLDGNTQPVPGCTNPTATNYNPAATVDDGSCIFSPPNPNSMLFISNQNNHPATAPALTEGMNVPAGSYSVFSNVAGKFDLYKDNVRVSHNGSATYFPHAENSAPYDMVGSSGNNANMFNFTQGNWKLIFIPNTGAVQTVNFTVGVVVPPPVPGCTDPAATNYNPNATVDDGSCVYPPTDVVVNVPVTVKVTKKANGTVEIEIPKIVA